jgi:hypothetical protein
VLMSSAVYLCQKKATPGLLENERARTPLRYVLKGLHRYSDQLRKSSENAIDFLHLG